MDSLLPPTEPGSRNEEPLILDIEAPDHSKTIERHNAVVREKLALRVASLIGGIMALAILSVAAFPAQAITVKDIVVSVVPQLVVVFGAIIGFYFGSEKHK